MKGPGLRLELDVRRVWRCAECGAERRTSGDRTIVPCHVCKSWKLMSLVEPHRAPRTLPEPLDLLIELHPDDVDVVASIPAEPIPNLDESMIQLATVEESPLPEVDTSSENPIEDKRREGKKSRRRSRKKNSNDQPAKPSATDDTSSRSESPLKDTSLTLKSPSPTDSFGEGL